MAALGRQIAGPASQRCSCLCDPSSCLMHRSRHPSCRRAGRAAPSASPSAAAAAAAATATCRRRRRSCSGHHPGRAATPRCTRRPAGGPAQHPATAPRLTRVWGRPPAIPAAANAAAWSRGAPPRWPLLPPRSRPPRSPHPRRHPCQQAQQRPRLQQQARQTLAPVAVTRRRLAAQPTTAAAACRPSTSGRWVSHQMAACLLGAPRPLPRPPSACRCSPWAAARRRSSRRSAGSRGLLVSVR